MRLRADTGACSWATPPRARLPRPAAARCLGSPCFDPALPRATRTAPPLTRPAPARNRQRSLGRGHVIQSRDALGTSAFRRPRVPPPEATPSPACCGGLAPLVRAPPPLHLLLCSVRFLPRATSKWWETFQALCQSFAETEYRKQFTEGT